MELFDRYDIHRLIEARGGEFNALLRDLLDYRKEKIIDYAVRNDFEMGLNVIDKFSASIETVVDVLGQTRESIEGFSKVILTGGASQGATDRADLIIGLGDADNTLTGGAGADKLLGGEGKDTYRAGNGDTIIDSDGKGEVFFDTDLLSGVKTEVEGSNGTLYEDARYYYRFESSEGRGKLTVAKKDSNGGFGGESLSIEGYQKGELEMQFVPKDQKSVELTLSDATVTEGGELSFTVALTEPLKYDLDVDVGAYFKEPGPGHADANDLEGALSGTVTVKAAETSATFTIQTLKDDDNNEGIEHFTFAATGYTYAGEGRADNDLGFLLIKNAGTGTIVDEGYDDTLKVEVSSQSMEESTGVMRFTVTLKGELKEDEKLTVDLATYDDTATGEYDYAHVTESVTFTKDTLTHTIEVPIYDDSYQESDERFFLAPRAYRDYQGDKTVELVNAGVGTILKSDPEGRIVIEVGSVSADEGDVTEAKRYQGIARKKGIFVYDEKFRHDFEVRRVA